MGNKQATAPEDLLAMLCWKQFKLFQVITATFNFSSLGHDHLNGLVPWNTSST